MKQTTKQNMTVRASVKQRRMTEYPIKFKNVYAFECRKADGDLRWATAVYNLVVDEGLNDVLDKYFLASAYTSAHYVGLKSSGSVTAGDTMAAHGAWTEITGYSEANRPTLTLGSVSGKSVDNSANKATFSISTGTSVAGAFVATDNTKSGSAGVLYGAADFSSPRTVADGDTLNVTVTLTASAT